MERCGTDCVRNETTEGGTSWNEVNCFQEYTAKKFFFLNVCSGEGVARAVSYTHLTLPTMPDV